MAAKKKTRAKQAKPAAKPKAVAKKRAAKARPARRAKKAGKPAAGDVVYTDLRRTLSSNLLGRLLGA
jgi:hypothetical protein